MGTLETAAGPLRVVPPSEASLAALRELFPAVALLADRDPPLLALVTQAGDRRLFGLRTGYGWYEGERAVVARRAALFGRMGLPAAMKAFRDRGFDGTLCAAACITDPGAGSVQEGELVFVRARAPFAGGLPSEPLEAWERFVGPHTTAALLTFVTDVDAVWKSRGVAERTLTDLEPCPADQPEVSWFADLVLTGGRFVLVRPEISADDPLLGALAAAGIAEVEWTPSAFVLGAPVAGTAAEPGN